MALQFAFPPYFSDEVCQAVHSLLQRESSRRTRCTELLGHKWLCNHAAPTSRSKDPSEGKLEHLAAPAEDRQQGQGQEGSTVEMARLTRRSLPTASSMGEQDSWASICISAGAAAVLPSPPPRGPSLGHGAPIGPTPWQQQGAVQVPPPPMLRPPGHVPRFAPGSGAMSPIRPGASSPLRPGATSPLRPGSGAQTAMHGRGVIQLPANMQRLPASPVGMNATSSSPPIGGLVLQRPHAPASAPQLAPTSPLTVGTGPQQGGRRFQGPCATLVAHPATARSPSPVATTGGAATVKLASTTSPVPISHPGCLPMGRNSFGPSLQKIPVCL